ncbi:Rv3235 family protein [Mycobacterium asiaticum]|uniref:Rv3235 family protein n=1 Tax=Mycobacterium asiaticum TaxID=1790 RepID=UPI00055B0CEF|nr:Rv3235 family protein [Mycobacterium asiaticum]OBJ53297.1 hypothetical protein A9W94_23660 [Mycobacterium asiaticum]ORA15286.1 hypothetical protein BST16_09820 [Mycobacterium asiaticum DSM 44297]
MTVTPVIDYEPPTRAVPRGQPSPPNPRTRRGSRTSSSALSQAPLAPQTRRAAAFADGALRRVLEVIDRRRPAAQLGAVLAPGLIDSVLSVSRSLGTATGAAVLRRMHVQPAGDRAAEVFGTYSRGHRVHAIACRVEQLPDRWLVVALHIG